MNKKLVGSILYFLFLAGLLSCLQDETNIDDRKEESDLVDPAGLYKFLNQQTDGSFSLTNSANVYSQEMEGTAKVEGAFYNAAMKSSANGVSGTATIGGIDVFDPNLQASLPTATTKLADALYGTDVEFVIKPATAKTAILDTMYVPRKIRLRNIPDPVKETYFYAGQTFTWEADPKNAKGVVIIVKYTPVENNKRIRDLQSREILWLKNVPDTGTFTLTQDLFKDIPNDAFIMLSIARGNYQYTGSGDVDIFSIYAYTIVNMGGYSK